MTGEDDVETAHLSGFPFLQLPLELREQIYSICFNPADHLVRNSELEAHGFYGGVYRWNFSLFYTNKQIYAESKKVWKRENVFVKIATPWPSAVNHISSEGLVPIVCTDAKADAFVDHHAVVQITAPFHGVVPEHTVVMLVDDLHLFTRTWYYSALSYPMLNERLSTTFILRNPRKNEMQQHCDDKSEDGEDGEESKKPEEGLGVPIALQRKLLLPFEHVKGLHGIRIYGYASSVQAELARLQALPIPSLQEALESATDYMAAGDAALVAPNTDKHEAAHQALDLYKKAFHAIHILIHGRTRRVLADVFFHDSITAGRYAGQTGITVRVILRLKLVARTIAAYNQLAQWNESAFWGMRSANILDENLNPDFEAFLTEVLGGADVAQIYLRTAIAFWHMEQNQEDWFGELIAYADDEMAGSGMLFEKAKRFFRFLPKEGARRELAGFGVPESVVEMFGDDGGRAAQEESENVVAEDGSVAGDG